MLFTCSSAIFGSYCETAVVYPKQLRGISAPSSSQRTRRTFFFGRRQQKPFPRERTISRTSGEEMSTKKPAVQFRGFERCIPLRNSYLSNNVPQKNRSRRNHWSKVRSNR